MKLLEWGRFEAQQDTSLQENISYLCDRQIFCVQAVPASHFGPFANLFQADRPTGVGCCEGGREGVNASERAKERRNGTERTERRQRKLAPHFRTSFPSLPLPQQQRVVVLWGKPGLNGFALRDLDFVHL